MTHQMTERQQPPKLYYKIIIGTFSAYSMFLRIEYLFIVLLTILTIFASCVIKEQTLFPKSGFNKLLTIYIGTAVGLLSFFILFGHILPDTAIAKQLELLSINKRTVVLDFFKAHMRASFFGIGSFFLWGSSMLVAFRNSQDKARKPIIIANLGMPLFLVLLVIRPQRLEGIRYFIFLEAFLIAFNILKIRSQEKILTFRLPAIFYIILVLTVISWLSIDFFVFRALSIGRSETYKKFLKADISFLKGRNGIAYDVGMIGFFSQGIILDVNGLVNGRELSKLTNQERIRIFSKQQIDFVFANEMQLHEVKSYLDLSNWKTIEIFDFPNASRKPDRHWLIVR